MLERRKLVKDLLLYSKPCQAAARRFDCHEFAAGLQPFVADVIGKRAIRFEIECEAFEIKTDPDLLKELLLNLLRNAVEALFNVNVLKVRTQTRKGKPRRAKFRMARTRDWKKAIVTVNPEQRINFF